MSMKRMAAGAALLALLASCGKPAEVTFEQRAEAASVLNPRIVAAQNDFGIELHRRLVLEEKGRNVFLSPASVSIALAMTYNGSAGQTQEAMSRTLGWQEMSVDEVNDGQRAMKGLLEDSGPGVQLDIANSLWAREGAPFRDDFLGTNRTYYEAEVSELDFNARDAHETINRWVEKNTKGKIPSILNEPLQAEDDLVLVNAIYFNGGWKDEFSPGATKERDFTLADGTVKQVPMMSREGAYEYVREDGYQAIRLPYGEGQMSMLVVLPDEASSLDALHERLWSDASRWRKPFPQSRGEIRLPRLKLEYGVSLNEALQSMGMELAFDRDRADFSAMSPRPHFIGDVKHKTFLEVNEKGTEAAAVTSVKMMAASAPQQPQERFLMQVDRPFFLAIEDRQTGAWLFAGSIYSP